MGLLAGVVGTAGTLLLDGAVLVLVAVPAAAEDGVVRS